MVESRPDSADGDIQTVSGLALWHVPPEAKHDHGPLIRRTQAAFSADGLSIEHRLERIASGERELVVNIDDPYAAPASCTSATHP